MSTQARLGSPLLGHGWAALLSGLLAAVSLSGQAASGAEQAAKAERPAPTVDAPAAAAPQKISPYVRFAREHAARKAKEPVKPSSFSVGRPPRAGPRTRR